MPPVKQNAFDNKVKYIISYFVWVQRSKRIPWPLNLNYPLSASPVNIDECCLTLRTFPSTNNNHTCHDDILICQ